MKPSKKSLSVRKRHFGMSCLELQEISHRLKSLKTIEKLMKVVEDDSDSDLDDLAMVHAEISKEILQIGAINPAIDDPLPKITRKTRTIDSFDED
jgi:hypothetical protein